MTSIRRYLLTLLIAVLTLCSFLAALQSYRQSVSRADQLLDADLTVLAASLMLPYQQWSQSLRATDLQLPVLPDLPANDVAKVPAAPECLATCGADLAGPATWFFVPPMHRPAGLARLRALVNKTFPVKRWRTYRQPETAGIQIVVAQPLQQRQQLTDEVVLASIYPVVLSLPLQALFIWLVVSKGLSPLRRFAQQLASKKADDLTPVSLPQVPAELSQVLASTNQLLARLNDAFVREKRFASDVAHELRTPLSVLRRSTCIMPACSGNRPEWRIPPV